VKLRARLPLVLTLLGFAGIGALAVRALVLAAARGAREALVVGAAFAVYAGWMAWESRVSRRETEKADAPADRATLELAAAAKLSLLVAALVPEPALAPWSGVGVLVLAIGVAIRARAVALLGRGYGHRIRPAASLVDRGLYAVVRHPAYLGTLVLHVGVVLVFWNPWSVAALVLLWAPAVLVRTVVEDRFLRGFPAYADYAARVRFRLVPFLF
jgi:protein-S-isoprenylcysteine O-methyltransferase Ste14